jgi:hypothetical protein
MIKYLRKNKNLSQLINILSPKSLETRLQIRAANDTCEYIEQNMLSIHSTTIRNNVLKQALEHAKLDGLYLDYSVFSGKTTNLIANARPNETVYGSDSFEGLPEFWRDGYKPGHFHTNDTLPKVSKNVELIKGWFSDTLPNFIENKKQDIAFIRIDCALYSSTVEIFKLLHPHIKKYTILVFDEYFNYVGWRDGEFKAFKEYTETYNVQYEYLTYNKFSEQVALKITTP